jgi:hypothetical protein
MEKTASAIKPRPEFADPLFILSLPRSFSSVVCAMLGQHPQMYGLPETNLLAADTLGEWWTDFHLGLEYPRHGLLRAIAQIYFGAQTETTVQRAAGWLRRRAHFSTGYLLEVIAETLRPMRILEKSPNIVRRIDFMQRAYSMFPKAKFLHLVRHPGGQGQSMLRFYEHRKAHGPMLPSHWMSALMTEPMSPGERRQDVPLDPQRGWYVLNARICEFLSSVPREQQLRIRAEDLLTDPDQHFRQIAGWLGLRTDAEAIEAMKHPENSPYAGFGPRGARYGNDPFFLNEPALRPARVEPQSLVGRAGWNPDGRGFFPKVRELAEQFGYQ